MKNDVKKKLKEVMNLRSLSHYLIGDKLGEGYFGKIVLATHVPTSEKVAVKIIEKSKIYSSDDKLSVEREINCLKMMKHPNIIQLLSVINAPTAIYLVTNYIEGVDLFDLIAKHKLKEIEAKFLFSQILSAVIYMHNLGITHRDLRLENILIDNNYCVKIIDFGKTNFFNDSPYIQQLFTGLSINRKSSDLFTTKLLSSSYGSLIYTPPEVLRNEPYDAIKAEIWSLGVLLYSMVHGYLPFDNSNQDVIISNILNCKLEYSHSNSDSLNNLIQGMLDLNPNKRLSMADILKHEWINTNFMPSISPGLNIFKNIIPIDEEIVTVMADIYEISREQTICHITTNQLDNISAIYYLLINKLTTNSMLSNNDFFKNKKHKDENYIKNHFNKSSFYSTFEGRKFNEYIADQKSLYSLYESLRSNNVLNSIFSNSKNRKGSLTSSKSKVSNTSKLDQNSFIYPISIYLAEKFSEEKIPNDNFLQYLENLRNYPLTFYLDLELKENTDQLSSIRNNNSNQQDKDEVLKSLLPNNKIRKTKKKRETVLSNLIKPNELGESNLQSKLKIFEAKKSTQTVYAKFDSVLVTNHNNKLTKDNKEEKNMKI